MEARRRRFLVRSATSWTEFKVVTSATLATVNGFAGGNGRLGLFRVGLDVSPSAGFDSAAVWHRVPRGLRRHAVAQTGLESPKARATCSGTQRAGHSPLAPRRMAAAKKRASNGKLVPLPVQQLRVLSLDQKSTYENASEGSSLRRPWRGASLWNGPCKMGGFAIGAAYRACPPIVPSRSLS